MRANQLAVAICVMLLTVGLVYSEKLINADETTQHPAAFGITCISQATPGAAFYYNVTIGPGEGHPSGLPQPPMPPTPIRVVVTSVKTVKDGAELTARVDKLNTEYDHERDGLYELKLVESKGRGQVLSRDFLAGGSGYPGDVSVMPDAPYIFEGYPDFVAMPQGQSAVVRNFSPGGPARWTQGFDAKTGKVTVKVDYYQHAWERDQKAGAKVLYWVKDKAELSETVPMGQEAAPLLQPGVDVPRDEKGMPREFNVVPVDVYQTEEQVWQPGALFPEKITRWIPLENVHAGLFRGLVFEADLVKVGTGPIVPPHPEMPPPPRPQAPKEGAK